MNGNDEERGHELGKKTKGRHGIHLMAGKASGNPPPDRWRGRLHEEPGASGRDGVRPVMQDGFGQGLPIRLTGNAFNERVLKIS